MVRTVKRPRKNITQSGREPALGGKLKLQIDGQEPHLGGANRILHLVEALEHPEAEVRIRAAFALSEENDGRAAPILADTALNPCSSRRMRERALRALDPFWQEIAPTVLEALCSRDACVRALASHILVERHDARLVPSLITILRDRHSIGRIGAAHVLGAFKSREAIPDLLVMLQAEYHELRDAAAFALRSIDEVLLVSSLIETFNSDGSLATRQETLRLLGQTESAEAVPPIIDALLNYVQMLDETVSPLVSDFISRPAVIAALSKHFFHESPEVRRFVVRAMRHFQGELKDATIIPILLEAAEAKDPETKAAVARILRRIKSTAAIPALAEILSHKAALMRMAAVDALGRTGDKAAIPPLVKALEDADADIRRGAVEALSEIGAAGEDGVLPLLIGVLHRDVDPQMRIAAAAALETIKNATAWPALIEALGDECEDVRQEVMTIVSRLEGLSIPDMLPIVLTMLHDDHGNVRKSAANALARFRAPGVEPLLIAALHDNDEGVRCAAATALAGSCEPGVIPALRQALHDGDPGVRLAAANALGNTPHPDVAAGLVEALQDSDFQVRRVAIEQLGNLGEIAVAAGAVPALIDVMHNQVESHLHWVAKSLGKIGNPTAIPDLLNILHYEPVSWLRVEAATALNCMDKPIATVDAAPVLIHALLDDSEQVRVMAARILAKISEAAVDAGAEPYLMAALESDSQTLRIAVAEALGAMGHTALATQAARELIDKLQRQQFSPHRDLDHDIPALGRLGKIVPEAGVVQALADLLGYNLSSGSRWPVQRVVAVLKEIGTPEALAVLDEYEKD